MNLKNRLDRLEQAAACRQVACRHLPPVVMIENEDGGEPVEHAEATDPRTCWCGRERLRIWIM